MNDVKNFLLAWASGVSTVYAAVEARTVLTLISAVVLPVIFFTIGKTVDVCLQIYFKRREEERSVATGGSSKRAGTAKETKEER